MAQKQAARAGWFRTFRDLAPVATTDLTANTALTVAKFTPGFPCIVEEFGYAQDVVATGTPALVWQLQDANSNVVAQLTLTTANVVTGKARGDFASTLVYAASGDGIRPDFRELSDTGQLQLKRISGTALGAGSGRFYVKLRSRGSQVS